MFGIKKIKETLRKSREYDKIEETLSGYRELHEAIRKFYKAFNNPKISIRERRAAKQRLEKILDKLQ